jgi:hypothetical protein
LLPSSRNSGSASFKAATEPEEALDWGSAPEFFKEKFRQYARDAIALLEQRREQMSEAA